MTYALTVLPRARRDLSSLSSPYFEAVTERLLTLKDNPRPHGCKKLRGRNGWRIRIGNYRVLYEIDDATKTVLILSVGHRKDVYD